jgi:hypothetical protein
MVFGDDLRKWKCFCHAFSFKITSMNELMTPRKGEKLNTYKE